MSDNELFKIPENIFKVFFKGIIENKEMDLTLNFVVNSIEPEILSNWSNFLREYNELTRKKHARYFLNIKDVHIYGTASKSDITQFYILLITHQINSLDISEGFLIGNHTQKGMIVLGYYPFMKEEESNINQKKVSSILELYLTAPTTFQKVILIM